MPEQPLDDLIRKPKACEGRAFLETRNLVSPILFGTTRERRERARKGFAIHVEKLDPLRFNGHGNRGPPDEGVEQAIETPRRTCEGFVQRKRFVDAESRQVRRLERRRAVQRLRKVQGFDDRVRRWR